MTGDLAPHPPRRIPFITLLAFVAALYLGREFFLPLVLAILVSFLLAPVIRRLESWRVGRVGAVVIATLLAFSVVGGVGYIVAGQFVELANRLPDYKANLRAKIRAIKPDRNTPLQRATDTLHELTAELNDTKAPPPPSTTTKAPPNPVPVQVVDHSVTAATVLKSFTVMLLSPLATALIVIVLVLFMLLGREDVRDRFVHLVGRGRLHLTTQAIDDAGQRVSRYLLAQFLVNLSFGVPVAIGLYFIGIPNALLWGLLSMLLRYIPYIGAWIAAAFPITLSLAISPHWMMPLLTVALYVAAELAIANVVEPLLYGARTGLAPIAVVVSAVFWAWLWGPVGLLLATPLTVCLAVLGKYIPSLDFLDILLGDKPPIAAAERLYQRLLALDEEEAADIFETAIQTTSLAAAIDDVLLPAVVQTLTDCRSGALDEPRAHDIFQLVRRLLAELAEGATPPIEGASALFLPASGEADELVALMLAQLVARRGISARVVSCKSLASEMVETAEESSASVACICALPPSSVMPAAYLAKRLRARLPEIRLVASLWHRPEDDPARRLVRLKRAGVEEAWTRLEKTSAEVAELAALSRQPPAQLART